MGFKFNDLELNASSAVSDATDSADAVSYEAIVTAADRKQLAELCENAGRVQSYALAIGETISVDPTGGANTLYVTTAASSQTQSGWFAVRSVSDSWRQRTTHAGIRIDLVKLAGADNAVGESSGFTEFLSHDF